MVAGMMSLSALFIKPGIGVVVTVAISWPTVLACWFYSQTPSKQDELRRGDSLSIIGDILLVIFYIALALGLLWGFVALIKFFWTHS